MVESEILESKNMKKWLLLICLSIFFFSCNDGDRLYEQNTDVPESNWFKDSVIVFEFEIQDTSVYYHLFYNVRNTLNYKYCNLYMQYKLSFEDELISSNQHEMYLFDKTTGKPMGSGGLFGSGSLGDVYDHRYPCLTKFKFPKTGTYRFEVLQYMRDEDPLGEILSVGLRIEKSKGI